MSGWASLEELERHVEELKAAKKRGTRATLRAGVFAAETALHYGIGDRFPISVSSGSASAGSASVGSGIVSG